MKLPLLAIAATLCSSALADDLEAILKNIDNTNFKVRQEARTALSNYLRPASDKKVQHLAKIYAKSKSPEVRSSIKHFTMLHLFGKGFLGVEHQGHYFSLEGKDRVGILLRNVTSGNPAQKSGLRQGDIIYEIAGKAFKAPDEKQYMSSILRITKIQDDFSQAVKSYKQGETIEISYVRNGKPMKTKATLASYNKYIAETNGLEVDADGFTKEEHKRFETMWQKFRQ